MTIFGTDIEYPVSIPVVKEKLDGLLFVPKAARGIVLFVHGSGSSRLSPRNQFVARVLKKSNLATLLFDLLTPEEEAYDEKTYELRFDIRLLAARLLHATKWIKEQVITSHLPIGYFGASTGGGAALMAAAREPDLVSAIVSRGGRPDLAGEALQHVVAPTLLIIGGDDPAVIDLNMQAAEKLECTKQVEVIPGATHLFEEPGKLEKVAHLANDWFLQYL